VLRSDYERLLSIKENVGFKSVAWAVHGLLEEQAKNLASVEAIMSSNVPVVLTGKPLSGKTYFVKQKLLPSLKGSPVLVVDCWDEYKELRNIGYDIYGLNFGDFKEHIRFIPNSQSRVAITEVGNIFAHLDMRRSELSEWIVVVEEAHTFKKISTFTKFLYGSRHIVRKMVAITPQTDAYQGIVVLTVFR
jgi:hypothetical protein